MKRYNVMPGLYISGMPKVAELSKLEDFDLIITLSKKMLPVEIAGVIKNRYCHLKDGNIDEEMLWYAVKLGVDAIRRGDKVLIHCLAGRNRSALVAALIYRELKGGSGQDAYEHIMRVRPKALWNRRFAEYLTGLVYK